jgi:hypothetical protein
MLFLKQNKRLIALFTIIIFNYWIIVPLTISKDPEVDYISEGELMVKSMEDAILSLIEKENFKNISIADIENLGDTSNLDNTLLYERLEDTFIKVFAKYGVLYGSTQKTYIKKEVKKEEKDYNNLTPEEIKEIEEDRKRKEKDDEDVDLLFSGEEKSSYEEDTEIYEEVEIPSMSSGDYTLKYRLLLCKVDYEGLKNWQKRRVATTSMYIRIFNNNTSAVEWAGEITGMAEDIIPHSYVDKLKDSRYIQVRIETGEDDEKNPLLEPLLVSGITAGLILLFSITAQSSE